MERGLHLLAGDLAETDGEPFWLAVWALELDWWLGVLVEFDAYYARRGEVTG